MHGDIYSGYFLILEVANKWLKKKNRKLPFTFRYISSDILMLTVGIVKKIFSKNALFAIATIVLFVRLGSLQGGVRMTEKQKILVRTRLTETDEQRFRKLAQANGTTTYQLVRKFIHEYLQQNSPTV